MKVQEAADRVKELENRWLELVLHEKADEKAPVLSGLDQLEAELLAMKGEETVELELIRKQIDQLELDEQKV